MAKFKPIEVLKSLSGKVCGHSDMYFAEKKGTDERTESGVCGSIRQPEEVQDIVRVHVCGGVRETGVSEFSQTAALLNYLKQQ